MFHERVAELRRKNLLTQKELAESLKLNRTTYAHYEKDREPEYKTLVNIADFFNVTTDFLLGRDTFIKNVISANSSEQLELLERSRNLKQQDYYYVNLFMEFLKWRNEKR